MFILGFPLWRGIRGADHYKSIVVQVYNYYIKQLKYCLHGLSVMSVDICVWSKKCKLLNKYTQRLNLRVFLVCNIKNKSYY